MRRNLRPSTDVFARRTGRTRIIALWLGVVALVLHGLIPLVQGLPGRNGVSGQPSSLVLCVAFAAKGGPAERNRAPTDDDRRSCPICQINALGKSFLPAAVAASPPAPDRSAEWRECAAEFAVGSSPRSGEARAPPKGA